MDYIDKMKIERLKHITSPSTSEMDDIFEMYKKYLDPNIQKYNVNCNCQNNIVNLYNKLIKWYGENS